MLVTGDGRDVEKDCCFVVSLQWALLKDGVVLEMEDMHSDELLVEIKIDYSSIPWY